MYSVREIFRIGRGPSSSHTMGPSFACERMLARYPKADAFRVVLQGSLAKTGRGHQTDFAIRSSLPGLPVDIVFDTEALTPEHPNTLIITAFKEGKILEEAVWFSIGGGAIREKGKGTEELRTVYQLSTLKDIQSYCSENKISLSDYVVAEEGNDINAYLADVWKQMKATVEQGLSRSGHLPGGLELRRKGELLQKAAQEARTDADKKTFSISAYAYAAAEENASGEMMVTAPTCGASGVLPAVLYYEWKEAKHKEEDILKALAVAGLIGNLIKTNASISGAECGCQAEIGSACSMAAAALCELRGLTLEQINCAAEIAMEHNLGLTCDPVQGLVQIPCIERNAMAALRAYEAATLAECIFVEEKVSFDTVVRTMKETGKDLSSFYRETSEGGLAAHYIKDFD